MVGSYKKSIMLLLLAVVFTISACSSNGGSASPEASDKPSAVETNKGGESSGDTQSDEAKQAEIAKRRSMKGTVNVLWEWPGTLIDQFKQVLAEFNKDYPNIQVNIWDKGGWSLVPMLSAGEVPDFMMTYNMSEYLLKDDLLEDLTPFIENDPEIGKETYMDAAIERYMYQGKLYGVPWSLGSPRVVGYHKDILEQYGYSEIPPINNLADMKQFLSKFWDVKNGEQVMTAFNPFPEHPAQFRDMMVYFALINGAQPKDFYDPETKKVGWNHPKIVEALEWMMQFKREYIDDARLTKLTESLPAGTSLFTNKKSAIDYVGGDAIKLKQQFPDFEVAALENVPMPLGGNGWSMISQSKNKDAAWELMKWLTASDNGIRAVGEIIPFKYLSKKDNPYLDEQAAKDPIVQKEVDLFRKAVGTAPLMAPVEYGEELMARGPEVRDGKMEPKAFLDHMTNYMQKLVDQQ